MSGEQLLTEREAAERLTVSTATLRLWRARGDQGPAYIELGPRAIRYRSSELEAWLDEQVVRPRA